MIRRLALLAAFAPLAARAQAYTYPTFQQPVLVEREYNFAAADAGKAGASLVSQWRERVAPRWQLGLDAGLADPDANADSRLLLGVHAARQLTTATTDFPFDVALTGGLGFTSGDGYSVLRLPVGASVGHSFLLDHDMRITPFVHPRLSMDRTSRGPAGNAESKLNVSVDLGASLQVTNQVAIRVSAVAGGNDYVGSGNGVGLSVAWTPKGLK